MIFVFKYICRFRKMTRFRVYSVIREITTNRCLKIIKQKQKNIFILYIINNK